MTENTYHSMYREAILANRELGGKDHEVPQPFQLSALERFHFDALTKLKIFRAKAAEDAAHAAGKAKAAAVKHNDPAV